MSWAAKLEKKLTALTDSASAESIQTLAKWIGFNRKHATALVGQLALVLQETSISTPRRRIYWQVLHELLILDRSIPAKWDRLADLRTQLGETVVIPTLEKGGLMYVKDEQLEAFAKQWDEFNVFGGPTLVAQIKRILAGKVDSKPAVVAAIQPPPPASPKSPDSPKKRQNDSIEEAITKKPKYTIPSITNKEVEYDFENKNIEAGKVESKEFLDPCKAIATLQIARDLRHDTAVQLSSLLAEMPDDIKAICQEGTEVPEDKIRDMSVRINDKLLDMDMADQLLNIRTLREIIEKQKEARENLVYLLIKSRCNFGADEAAEAFLDMDSIAEKLKERKSKLSDAMELEGLDFEEVATDEAEDKDKNLELTWYKPESKA